MAITVQSKDMVLEVREAGASAAEWKKIVCTSNDQGSLDSETTETSTRCGKFTGVQEPTGEISGDGAVNVDAQSDEATLLDIQTWQKNVTLLDARYYNEANGSITAGSAVNMQGQGYFTSSAGTGNDGEVVQFTFTFTFTGEILIGEAIS